jgi:LacI family transcriptional regulator
MKYTACIFVQLKRCVKSPYHGVQTANLTSIKLPETVVTMEHVAERAGVSLSTVSRILNGSATVSETKRRAVDKAVAELGFVPNPMARGLAGGRTFSVGVVTQSIDSPFYGVALRGIEEELAQASYSPLFVSGHWNADEESRCIDMLRARRVDGIIVLTGRLSNAVLNRCARDLPVVATGRSVKAASNFYSLYFDNVAGGRLATEHLLALGHRRIAFIAGNADHPDANERLHGYRTALETAGIAFDPALVTMGMFHEESGRMAMEELLDRGRPFTALFAANDQMALGACLALNQRGIRIPQDISLIGFDDLIASRYSMPPLTTIHHPAYELGQLAAHAMLSLLRGEKPNLPVPQPYVVIRESTA